MLSGVICARHKPWLFSPLSFAHGLGGAAAASHRHFVGSPINFNQHSGGGGGAASIWHSLILASPSYFHKPAFFLHEQKGEGSWNVAWDARPARWLHRPDSAWLLFGSRACLAPSPFEFECTDEQSVSAVSINAPVNDEIERSCVEENVMLDDNLKNSVNYKVKGVLADGRCLFRAIAHMSCLRNGEEAPDEKRQTELADELRSRVVDELLMRRKDTEWFIEGDFDAYVERIRLPYVWGGEPELLMASHILKTMISVYMLHRSSDSFVNIANYGEEYQKDGESPIKVLFHGYGHYDILEAVSEEQSCGSAETYNPTVPTMLSANTS